MSQKPSDRPDASREARLAKALRENLARRKALTRTRRSKGDDGEPVSGAISEPAEARAQDDEPSP